MISWSNSFNCFLPGGFSALFFHTDLHTGPCFLKDMHYQKNMTPQAKVVFPLPWEKVSLSLPIREWGGESNHVFLEKHKNMHMQYSK